MYFHKFHRFWGFLSITLVLIANSIPSSDTSPAISSSGNAPSNGLGSIKVTQKRRRRKYKERCKAGKIYNVTSMEYLKDNVEELHCIFWAAEEPTKVPVGPLYGDVLTVANVRLMNPLLRMVWKGKFIEKAKCQENETFIGWNRIVGQPLGPFEAYLGKLNDSFNVHPVYGDKKVSLIIDYRKEMSTVCPEYLEMTGRQFESLPVRKSPAHMSFFPLNACIDVLRFVGRQEDGGAILLGELFLVDKFSSSQIAKPVLFFSLVSYDPDLNKEFVYGQPLKPLESDNYYKSLNVLDAVMLALPINNMLSEPIHAVKAVASEVGPSGRGFGNSFWDLCCSNSKADTQRLAEEFRAFQPNVTTTRKKSRSKFISKHEELHSHFKEL